MPKNAYENVSIMPKHQHTKVLYHIHMYNL